jgi:hypothetical protein
VGGQESADLGANNGSSGSFVGSIPAVVEEWMKTHVPAWLALAGCAGCLLVGASMLRPARAAQAAAPEPKAAPEEVPTVASYPYLPPSYGKPFVPSVAEWEAMRLTSLGASTTRLTEEFTRRHVTCFPTPKGLVMTLDLSPEPGWKLYKPGGTFSAPPEKVKPDLEKAIAASMRFARNFFPEVADKDVSIRLFIYSERVGTWENGKLLLNGEKP